MSPRKRTIDDLDDIDDEDGVLEEEKAQETDLDLTIADPEDVAAALPPEFDQEEEER
ncbi:MAG TPA: hypothetical protein VGQ24_16225 [Gemmatimonadales bacterium]|nr:hypothetical protein [Gemmatimonadales bacterium]